MNDNVTLGELAKQARENNISMLDRLRKWLLVQGFVKVDDKSLSKIPLILYSFTGENEVWILRFPSTNLYIQLAKNEVLMADSSGRRFHRFNGNLLDITHLIIETVKSILQEEQFNQSVDLPNL